MKWTLWHLTQCNHVPTKCKLAESASPTCSSCTTTCKISQPILVQLYSRHIHTSNLTALCVRLLLLHWKLANSSLKIGFIFNLVSKFFTVVYSRCLFSLVSHRQALWMSNATISEAELYSNLAVVWLCQSFVFWEKLGMGVKVSSSYSHHLLLESPTNLQYFEM